MNSSLIVGGMVLGSGLFLLVPAMDSELPPTVPASMAIPTQLTSSTSKSNGLIQLAADLEDEIDRLDAASRELDARALALLGPPKEGSYVLRIPQKQESLVRYLKECLELVENVEHSFGELVAGQGQVDLRERIPEARKHVKRLEMAGAAGMLARRQVRAWIEKDLQAVEALCEDWPDLQAAADQFAETAKDFDSGRVSYEEFHQRHLMVLKSAESRTRFHESRLGQLCGQMDDAATHLHLKRQSEPTIAARQARERLTAMDQPD